VLTLLHKKKNASKRKDQRFFAGLSTSIRREDRFNVQSPELRQRSCIGCSGTLRRGLQSGGFGKPGEQFT
jgi:hypothetical protein